MTGMAARAGVRLTPTEWTLFGLGTLLVLVAGWHYTGAAYLAAMWSAVGAGVAFAFALLVGS